MLSTLTSLVYALLFLHQQHKHTSEPYLRTETELAEKKVLDYYLNPA